MFKPVPLLLFGAPVGAFPGLSDALTNWIEPPADESASLLIHLHQRSQPRPDTAALKAGSEQHGHAPLLLITDDQEAGWLLQLQRQLQLDALIWPQMQAELGTTLTQVHNRFRRQRQLRHLRQNAADCLREQEKLMSVAPERERDDISLPLFVQIASCQILNGISALSALADATHPASAVQAPTACKLQPCPRLKLLRQTLEHSVAVLEQTRNTFKSKELAQLRRDLERVLDGLGQ